jgi:hypothetical protein
MSTSQRTTRPESDAQAPVRPPALRPCGSCPYRLDVPSGVWSRDEYDKLPLYDGETGEQDPSVFLCHQQDGHACAGWVACHDMNESLGLRVATALGIVADPEPFIEYTTDVPVFATGAEAREHGLAELELPGEKAVRTIDKLQGRRGRA